MRVGEIISQFEKLGQELITHMLSCRDSKAGCRREEKLLIEPEGVAIDLCMRFNADKWKSNIWVKISPENSQVQKQVNIALIALGLNADLHCKNAFINGMPICWGQDCLGANLKELPEASSSSYTGMCKQRISSFKED